jgi:hypothetical protein
MDETKQNINASASKPGEADYQLSVISKEWLFPQG